MTKALLIPMDEYPREIEVNGYEDLQKVVGGRIEPVSWVFGDAPTLYVNAEGKFTCLPNRAVFATDEEAGQLLVDGTTAKKVMP